MSIVVDQADLDVAAYAELRRANGPALAKWAIGVIDNLPYSSKHAWGQQQKFTASYLKRWIRDDISPDVKTMAELAEALDMPFVEILIRAKVVTREEVDRPEPQPTVRWTIEQAVDASDLTEKNKIALKTFLESIREVESGMAERRNL